MQKHVQIIPGLKFGLKVSVIIGLIFFLLHLSIAADAAHSLRTKAAVTFETDTSVMSAIKTAENAGSLLYPLSVERFND